MRMCLSLTQSLSQLLRGEVHKVKEFYTLKGQPIPLEFGQIIPISEHLDQYTPQHFSHIEFYSKIQALGCLALHKKIIYAILDLHFLADPDVTENLCLTLPLYTLDDVPAAFLANYEEKELENVNMQSIEKAGRDQSRRK